MKSIKASWLRASVYFLICNFILIGSYIDAATEWTVLVYVQANNNLSPFAMKNFSDMASIGSNNCATLLVQWYQPGHQGVWRYKVEKGKMVLEECNPAPTDGNSAKDLTEAMGWAVTKYPAQKYFLILWDHGIGVLDPAWGNKNQSWSTKEQFAIDDDVVKNNPRIQIDGITMDDTITFTKQIDSVITPTTQRAILFNETSRTYMDNYNLSMALRDIKNNILKGKKIDLLGMDACLMAMLEVGYLARQYASVLIASQEVELAHGWDYSSFSSLVSLQNTTPFSLAQGIVHSYGAYYRDKVQFYTQSAMNLERVSLLKENLDGIANAFRSYQQNDKNIIVDLAKRARRSCLQFSASGYVDLHTFLSDFLSQINQCSTLKSAHALDDLKRLLQSGMHLVEQTVLASVAGRNLARAKGISIYFPITRIDASYPKTDFAKDCQWYGFIKELCGC